ncbi:unnamed protein product [Camellia sinensis]
MACLFFCGSYSQDTHILISSITHMPLCIMCMKSSLIGLFTMSKVVVQVQLKLGKECATVLEEWPEPGFRHHFWTSGVRDPDSSYLLCNLVDARQGSQDV